MRRRWLVLAGVTAIALTTPASAPAFPGLQLPHREIQQPNTHAIVRLGEAGGYEIGVSNPDRYVAILYVDRIGKGRSRSGLEFTSTAYAVRPSASLSGGVLRASFGPIGKVALRFRPSGKVKLGRRDKQCRGRRPRTEFGEYRGHVSLRGEGGYFHLRVRRAEGTLERSFRMSCAPGRADRVESQPLAEYVAPNDGFITTSAGGNIVLLHAVSKSGGGYVTLRASHLEGSAPGAEVQAGVLESEPGMAIGREAVANGGAGTLLTSLPGEHPATATLAPPAPFHGEAHYVENSSSSHSWTGTLSVGFPGLDLPLAGPGFATSLCVLSPFKSRLPCDFRNQPVVPE